MIIIKSIIYLIIIIIIFNNIIIINGDNIIGSNYTLKNVRILDTEVEIISGEVYFDEPIYLLESYTCPTLQVDWCEKRLEQINFNTSCPPCDYTHEGCSKGYQDRPSECDPCNEPGIPGNILRRPCDQVWEDLQLGVHKQGFISYISNSNQIYRYYLPYTECKGYKVSIRTIQGKATYLADFVPISPVVGGSSRAIQSEEIDASFTFCPNTLSYVFDQEGPYNTEYPYGTLHIGILNRGITDYIFDIVIEEIDIVFGDVGTCTQVDPNIPCLADGETVYVQEQVDQGSFLKYSFQVDECKNITISTVTLINDVDIYATDDQDPNNFSIDNYKWGSSYSLDDTIIIQVCPNENESYKIIYIGIMAYYSTDIFFSISTKGQYRLTDISTLPTVGGTYALSGSSQVIYYDDYYEQYGKFVCDNYDSQCIDFFPISPRVNNNPLYPVPNTFLNGQGLSQFEGVDLNETVNSPKSNAYQFGLLTKVTINGVIYNYFNTSYIESATLEFLDRLVYANGKSIGGSISFGDRAEPKCSYEKFIKISNEQNNILEKIDKTSANFINGLRYYFDVLSFEDDYYSCKLMAESYMIFNYTTSLQDSTMCSGTSNPEEYLNDPCCSLYATFSKCCTARQQEVTTKTFVGTNSTVYNDCSFPDCATSVLETLVDSVIGSQYDQCKISNSEEDYYTNNLYSVFRSCKSAIEPKPCQVDNDCNGGAYKCNQRNGVCLIPSEQFELDYIKCILENIADPLRSEVVRVLSLSNITDENQLAQKLHEVYSFYDCATTYGIQQWSRLVYSYSPSTEINGYCYPYSSGLDSSVGLSRYDSCYQGTQIFTWVAQVYSNESCQLHTRCDWMGDKGSSAIDANIETKCNTNTPLNFCGDCSDPVRTCYTDSTLTSKETCESNYVCYKRDHNDNLTYETGLKTVSNATECLESSGTCSVGCGIECDTDLAGCVIKSSFDWCGSINNEVGELTYNPAEQSYYCAFYKVSEEVCLTYSDSQYKKCDGFNDDTCTICNDPINGCDSFGLRCKMRDIKCKTKEECEAAGECSDKYLFSYQIGLYPTYKPKCLFPRTTIPLFTKSLPTCQYQYQQDTPFGCFDFNITLMDEGTCNSVGGLWWETYAKTEQQCNGYRELCYGLDDSVGYLLPLTSRFNEKDEDNCKCAREEWKKPFTWKKGEWIDGKAVQLQWIQTNSNPVTQISEYKTTLNFPYFFSVFKDALFSRTTLLYKSEVLCRSSNSKNSIEALSCSCASNVGDSCFEKLEPPVLKVMKPCYDGDNTTIFNDGTLLFAEGAVSENNCVSVSIGQVFKDTFLSKKVLGLSSTFVTFDRPADYSIFNQKRATIGKLLADGINLQFYDNGVKNFQLCMYTSSSRDSKVFPHLDYSILVNEKDGEVRPLGCNVTNDLDGRYCCTIDDLKVGQNSYFLIERIRDWEGEGYKPFKTSSSAMLYILAVFFLLMAIYGILNLLLFVFQRLLSTEPFKLVHLLFLVLTAFCIIRSIYFFVLPSGYIKESTTVGNYILVVLPTFLYFTAFTVVIVIWYMLSSAQSFNTNIYKRIYMMIFVINVILYIFFIIIVVVFNFTQEDDPPTCGGRLSISLEQTKPQNIVSILYAVLQAVLSLAIGFAFIYYGRLVYNKLRGLPNNVSSTAEKQKKRTMHMAIICSTGFVLHCIFIIILVSVNPSNIVFSFVCLIVTEIVPVITLFFTNNQIPIFRYSRRGVKTVMKLTSTKTSQLSSETTSTTRKSHSKKSLSQSQSQSQSSITPE